MSSAEQQARDAANLALAKNWQIVDEGIKPYMPVINDAAREAAKAANEQVGRMAEQCRAVWLDFERAVNERDTTLRQAAIARSHAEKFIDDRRTDRDSAPSVFAKVILDALAVGDASHVAADFAAELCRLRAQETRIRALCVESENEKWMREISRDATGQPICQHTVLAADILAALDTKEGQA